MKYASTILILAISATVGCGGSSAMPEAELTPDVEAQIKANDEDVKEAESALRQSKRQ